jgi:hypothetical protein
MSIKKQMLMTLQIKCFLSSIHMENVYSLHKIIRIPVAKNVKSKVDDY